MNPESGTDFSAKENEISKERRDHLKILEQNQAYFERWKELAENSVFPLEHTVDGLARRYERIEENPKREAEFLQNISTEIAKIDPERLAEVMKNTEGKDFLELKSRAVNAMSHLFNDIEYSKKLKLADPEYARKFKDVVISARDKAVLALNSVISDDTFLRDYNGDYNRLQLLAHCAPYVSPSNEVRLYNLFEDLGRFADVNKMLEDTPEMLELVAKYGSTDQRKLVEDAFFKAIMSGINNSWKVSTLWLEDIQLQNSLALRNIASAAFERVKSAFKERFGFELREVTKDQQIKLSQWPETIKVIAEIEVEHNGGAKQLSDKYGIHCFYRYPADVLVEQLSKKWNKSQYGVVVFAYSDHNDAFAKDVIDLSNLSQALKKRKTSCKIVESGSGIGLMKEMIKLNREFGKASFLILNAHGQENDFLLSNQSLTKSATVDKSMIAGAGVQRMKDFFVDNPDVVLLSCSTGAKGGIGEQISKNFGARVVAPNKPTGINRVRVSFDADEKPRFQVEFSTEKTLEEYNSKI